MDKPFRLVDKAADPPAPTMRSVKVWDNSPPFLEIDQFVARPVVWPHLSVALTTSVRYERLGERLAAMWRLFWFGDAHVTIVVERQEAQRLADYLKDVTAE